MIAPLRTKDQMPPWLIQATLTVIGVVLAAYLALQALGKLHHVLFWVFAALFLSFAVEPLVNKLVRRGWRRGWAAGLIIIGSGLFFFVFIAAMVPLVISQVRGLVESSPGWITQITRLVDDWFHVHVTTDQLLHQIQNTNISVGSVAGNALTLSTKILGGVFQVLTVLLFTYWIVVEGPKLRRRLLSLMPADKQKIILSTWETAMEKTGGYLYSRLILGGIGAALSLIVLTIVGVPFALPLALWIGLISQFVPVIGTYIAMGVPLMVALLENPWSALILFIFFILYQQIENYFLSPRITAHTMQLHPAIAIFSAIVGGTLLGPAGAFLALPLAAILQATFSEYLHSRHELIDDDNDLLYVEAKRRD